MNSLTFSKGKNKLEWGIYSFNAISGGFGKGPLPTGTYEVRIRHVVVNADGAGYVDSITKESWFIPLLPEFSTDRDGFGIHPDGNKKGTKGCVGLQGKDASRFWTRWLNSSMSNRPVELLVTE